MTRSRRVNVPIGTPTHALKLQPASDMISSRRVNVPTPTRALKLQPASDMTVAVEGLMSLLYTYTCPQATACQ